MGNVNIYRALRVCAGLSIKELSNETGISEIYLSELERGIKKNPSLNILDELARVHKTEVDILRRFALSQDIDYRSILLSGLCELKKMRYRIESIESKRSDRLNKWHGIVTGKTCIIKTLDWCGMACFQIEDGVDAEEDNFPMIYHTSLVLKIEEKDGVLTIETQNSVYTLRVVGNFML